MTYIMQKIRAPYMGASFLMILTLTTSLIAMESELKKQLGSNETHDVRILMEQSTVDDCDICYETTEVMSIPCTESDKHPKICNVCLNGCNDTCPYCRRNLIIEKKHFNVFMEPELRKRLVSNETHDVRILMEQSAAEDYDIRYEAAELMPIPCSKDEDHPKMCSECLNKWHETYSHCRRKLIVEKKHSSVFMDDIYQCAEEHMPACIGCGCFSFYLCMMLSSLL